LFTAVVGELSSPTVLIDVRHLLAADESGLAVIAAEDAHRRVRRGRLMLVGSPVWLQSALHELGHEQLLPWIRSSSSSAAGPSSIAS
jgi:hypothetical protein